MIFDVTLRVCDEGEKEGKVDRESKRMTMKKHRRETGTIWLGPRSHHQNVKRFFRPQGLSLRPVYDYKFLVSPPLHDDACTYLSPE